jgi:hypothetical protein
MNVILFVYVCLPFLDYKILKTRGWQFFFSEEPDNKYIRLCGPRDPRLCHDAMDTTTRKHKQMSTWVFKASKVQAGN